MSWFWAVLAALAAAYAWRQHVLRVRAQDELDRLSVRGESMRRVLEHLDEGALLLSQSGEVVYANRALAHIRVRNFLSAVEDCSRAIEISRFLDDDFARRPPPSLTSAAKGCQADDAARAARARR